MSAEILGKGVIDWHSDGDVLTRAHKEYYLENGFVVVKNLVAKQELEKYAQRFKDICEKRVSVPHDMIVMKDIAISKDPSKTGEGAITKLVNFEDDPVLYSFCQYEPVIAAVKDLIGHRHSTVVSLNTMLINKPPDAGHGTSRHPMHQDQVYFPFGPSDYVTCAWTAIQKVHRANGCLVVVPGTHKGPLYAHEYPKWEGGVNKAYHGIQNFDPSMPRFHVEMEAGDTVFFNPVLIHGSGTNRTDGFRKAMCCHYANDDLCQYKPLNEQQESTVDDVLDMMRVKMRKLGMTEENMQDITLQDLWSMRARAVNGTKSNL